MNHYLPPEYMTLRLLASTFFDIQDARIGIENRKRAYEKVGILGGTELLLDSMLALERDASAMLVEAYLLHAPPQIITWQRQTNGLGEHQIALLLGLIGDPLVAIPLRVVKVPDHLRKRNSGVQVNNVVPDGDPYPRTVSNLRAYCGHGAPLRRWRASATREAMTGDDAKALGNMRAKKTVWLIVKSLHMQGNTKYTALYEQAKQDKLNLDEPWTPGHADAHARRIMGKHFLLELWLAAGGGKPEVPEPVKKAAKKIVRRKKVVV